MNRKDISDSISGIDESYVIQAAEYKHKRGTAKRWIAAAACLAVVAATGFGLFQGGVFDKKQTVTLESGNTIVFEKSHGGTAQSDSKIISANTRQLEAEEIKTLFGDLPVTANAYFDDDNILTNIEGELNGVKLEVCLIGKSIRDVIIVAPKTASTVNGVDVSTGYFVTDPNSKGERNAIYTAEFKQNGVEFYLENGGSYDDSQATAQSVAAAAESLINAGVDLSKVTF